MAAVAKNAGWLGIKRIDGIQQAEYQQLHVPSDAITAPTKVNLRRRSCRAKDGRQEHDQMNFNGVIRECLGGKKGRLNTYANNTKPQHQQQDHHNYQQQQQQQATCEFDVLDFARHGKATHIFERLR